MCLILGDVSGDGMHLEDALPEGPLLFDMICLSVGGFFTDADACSNQMILAFAFCKWPCEEIDLLISFFLTS